MPTPDLFSTSAVRWEVSTVSSPPALADPRDHRCAICGAWGAFGFGVSVLQGRRGRWFCLQHRGAGR